METVHIVKHCDPVPLTAAELEKSMKNIRERFHCMTFLKSMLGNKKQEEGLDKKTKGCKSTGVADKRQAKEPRQDIDFKHKRARKKMFLLKENLGLLSSWRQHKLYSKV